MQQPLYRKQSKPWQVIDGSTLKMIAVITMLIDHVGAGLIAYMYSYGRIPSAFTQEQFLRLYQISRAVGRTAFPIYCFLLVQGLRYTSSRLRYMLWLFVFAVISEIPFDLAIMVNNHYASTFQIVEILRTNLVREMEHQNVFFTLAIGLAVIWAMDETLTMTERNVKQMIAGGRNKAFITPAYVSGYLVCGMFAAAGWYLADLLRTDYNHSGVMLIVILYLLQRLSPLDLVIAYLYFAFLSGEYNEQWTFAAFLLLYCYSGRRGFIRSGNKFWFYAFYPVHMFLIYVARALVL